MSASTSSGRISSVRVSSSTWGRLKRIGGFRRKKLTLLVTRVKKSMSKFGWFGTWWMDCSDWAKQFALSAGEFMIILLWTHNCVVKLGSVT
jgi:hypothetical protein